MRTTSSFARRAAGITAALTIVGGAAVPALASGRATACKQSDWSQYGATAAHSFQAGCSPITSTSVATLVPKWFFHTQDSVTASPAVVGDTVYVGAWDGRFYALNAATGAQRWTFDIRTANPTAFGQIVSSAAVERFPTNGHGSRLVVVFGGGSTLWALDAATGRELAAIDLDPRTPALRAKQQHSANPPVVEIESSPAVADIRVGHAIQKRIYVGLDVHNDPGVGRTGIVALRLVSSRSGHWSFVPVWKNDPETDRTYYGRAGLTVGSGQGQGCGDVWSSPAVSPSARLVVYGVGNCDDPAAAKKAGQNWSEAMVGVDAVTGKFLWRYAPSEHMGSESADIAAANRDADFGASANIFTDAHGQLVAGEGAKNATYYARTARSGKALWQTTNGSDGYLQQGFAVGGFIGSTAVASDARGRAQQVVGATAIPIPHSAQQLVAATQDVRALNALTGKLTWSAHLVGPTYASTSIVNDVVLVPVTTASSLVALNLKTGLPVWTSPVLGPPSSTAVVSGKSVYLGTGTNETDLEYKALGLAVPATVQREIGQSPLSPASGIQAWTLP